LCQVCRSDKMDKETKKFIEAVIAKREAEGLSLRKLADITQVSFSTLSRLQRFEGSPDNNTKVRLVNWLGADQAARLGLKSERIASVHFRASKNVDSKTIEALMEAALILKNKISSGGE